jgi:hypothetical protein
VEGIVVIVDTSVMLILTFRHGLNKDLLFFLMVIIIDHVMLVAILLLIILLSEAFDKNAGFIIYKEPI